MRSNLEDTECGPPAGHAPARVVATSKQVEVAGALHRFSAVSPRDRGGDGLAALLHWLERGDDGQRRPVLFATLFVHSDRDRDRVRQAVAGNETSWPPLACVVQAPLDGAETSLVSWELAGPEVSIEYVAPHSALARQPGLCWAAWGGFISQSAQSTTDEAEQSLVQLVRHLQRADLRPADLVKIWIYVDGICAADGESTRYQALNRARHAVFEQLRFDRSSIEARARFPASTGIGARAAERQILVAGVACRGDGAILVPLENFRQTPAYRYPSTVSDFAPLFSRAMVTVVGDTALTYISGTASILGTGSAFENDAAAQTRLALENIDALLAVDSLRAAGVPVSAGGLASLVQCTVYITRRLDAGVIRALCTAVLPAGVPVTYIEGDVCRPELLVEIEGVAWTPIEGALRKSIGHSARESP